MQYRKMGNTGLIVSEISLGGWITYGGSVEDRKAKEIIRCAFDKGINFFDTAEVYADGRSEEVMGNALKDLKRSEVVLATKVQVGEPPSRLPNQSGLSRKHILEACDASLKRLKSDYIDLYYAHHWDSNVNQEETLCAFNDLVRAGKVLYIGCSNFTAKHLYESIRISERNGWARYECIQSHYNLFERSIEAQIIPFCSLAGIAVHAYCPLAFGILTGKYKPGHKPPKGSRGDKMEWMKDRLTDERLRAVEKLRKLAAKRKKSVSQLALAWTLRVAELSSAIIGATKPKHIEENIGGSGWELSDEEISRIDPITKSVQYSADS